MLLSMRFLGEFERRLIFQGFEVVFGGIVVIFRDVKSGEMLDFSGGCRSRYRSDFGDFCGLMVLINLIFEVEVWMEEIAWFTPSNTCLKM